jgi:hypothetical protein
MPVINCTISEGVMQTLRRLAGERGLPVEFFAEAAIETTVMRQQREDDARDEAFRRARKKGPRR